MKLHVRLKILQNLSVQIFVFALSLVYIVNVKICEDTGKRDEKHVPWTQVHNYSQTLIFTEKKVEQLDEVNYCSLLELIYNMSIETCLQKTSQLEWSIAVTACVTTYNKAATCLFQE